MGIELGFNNSPYTQQQFGLYNPNMAQPQRSTNSNISGGGLGDLLNQLQNNKGLFGLGDVATGGLLGFGTSLLSGIGSALSGPTRSQKEARNLLGEFRNAIGQDVFNPDSDIAAIQRAQMPQLQANAQRLERRFGLDSGVAQGQLAYDQSSGLANALLALRQQNNQLKASRDSQLRSLMAQLTQVV